jgi:hypothetical protein
MKKELQQVLGVGILAGAAGGLITGLCARSVIWFYTLCTRIQPGCTPHNTQLLIGCFMLSGGVLGPLFLWLTRSGPGPIELRSCVFCILVVLAMTLPVRMVQNFEQGALSHGLAVLSAILFAVLLPVFGLSIGMLTRVVERRLSAGSTASR